MMYVLLLQIRSEGVITGFQAGLGLLHRLHSPRLAKACAVGNRYEPNRARAPPRRAAIGAANSVAELCERSTKFSQRPATTESVWPKASRCAGVCHQPQAQERAFYAGTGY